jgi:branched-chain amino acid transport system permease protein
MKRLFGNINFWAAVIIAILPLFFGDNFFRIVSLGAIYAIAALGMSLLLGYTGQISMGQAAFTGIGAYTTGLVTTLFNWPGPLALFSSIVVSAVIAFVLGKPILKTKGYFLALATLGFGEIFYVFVSQTDPVLRGFYGIAGVPSFTIAGYELSSYIQMYYLHWGILLGLLIFSQNMVNSRVGRALLAVNTDEVAASAMGVDVAKYKLKIFVLCGIYGGIAGSLLANYIGTAQPHGFTVGFSIFIILAVVVGGMGNLWGVVLSTVILAWLRDEKLSQYMEYSSLMFGIILILIFIFCPQGIGSLAKRIITATKWRPFGRRFGVVSKKAGS